MAGKSPRIFSLPDAGYASCEGDVNCTVRFLMREPVRRPMDGVPSLWLSPFSAVLSGVPKFEFLGVINTHSLVTLPPLAIRWT
jgi:hypothetical protein